MRNAGTKWLRIVLWSSVVIYTAALPHAIIVYRQIVNKLSLQRAGQVPVVMVVVLAVVYVMVAILKGKRLELVKILAPCFLLTYGIISLESIPNKHIHIPEYIALSWLIFAALRIDYRGRGMLALVFLSSSLLGLVDELEQGIHPNRYYGLSDMVVNSVSALMGVLGIAGIFEVPKGNLDYGRFLKQPRPALILIIAGSLVTLITLICMFQVAAAESFQSIYPFWLLVGNILFLTLGSVLLVYYFFRLRQQTQGSKGILKSDQIAIDIDSFLWIIIPLVILLVIQGLIVSIAVFGWKFQ